MKLNKSEIVHDIKLENIPTIELYVDQIINLLNKSITEEDKYLTKAMINNYSKAKIIQKIKGRKYSKAHVIIIAIINRLKQTLTINEIKTLIDRSEKAIIDNNDNYILSSLEKIYNSYTDIFLSTYNNQTEMGKKLLEISNITTKEQYLLIETLCLSALSQSYQQKVKNAINQ